MADTLRPILQPYKEVQYMPNSGLWEPIPEDLRDFEIDEDHRYEVEGTTLVVRYLERHSLHWRVAGTYRLR